MQLGFDGHPSTQEIIDILSPHAAGYRLLGELLVVSVGRVLLRIARRGEDWRSQISEEQLGHITDWLRAALVNSEQWLQNVDDQGRPKKLMKFGSLGQIAQEADKAMLGAVRKLSGIKLIEGDEELFGELEDGFYIVRLLTPAALDRESAEMQHCIGNGGYDRHVRKQNFLYLSLRDKAGKAHATLEIRDGRLVQLQGKQNRPPIQTYIDQLVPFIRTEGYDVAVPATHLGYVIDIHGYWHDIYALPEVLEVDGNLNLIGSNAIELPKGLKVGGDLRLFGACVSAFPMGLEVGGDLNLIDSSVNALPDGLKVGGDLNLVRTGVRVLTERLEVGGDLNLRYTSIEAISAGLKVGGDLNLRDTKVRVLPEGLEVGRDLDLSYTSIISLPEGLKVGRRLRLPNANITTLLPDSITDETEVYCYRGWITAKKYRRMHNRARFKAKIRSFLQKPMVTLATCLRGS